MNILFLTHWYPSQASPISGIFVREHALAVSSMHNVTVLHIAGIDGNLQRAYRLSQTSFQSLFEYHLGYAKSAVPKTTWIQRFSGSASLVDDLERQGRRPDIIHANIFSTADLAFYLSKRFRIPTVISEHSSAYARNLLTKSQAARTRLFMNRLDGIMPVCHALQDAMQNFGIKGAFKIVPNAVDTDTFTAKTKNPAGSASSCKLITVSSLTPNKSIQDILDALRLLEGSNTPYELTIVGDGPERASLEQYAERHLSRSRVSFAGWKSKPEVANLLHRADIFIMPSRWENQPVALLEALSVGLPAIAARVGGIPEILQQPYGMLFDPGDATQLAEAIRNVSGALSEYPPEAVHQYIQSNFSYPVVASKFDAVYRHVLGN